MAKDPAFLFYPGDWLGGTQGMSLEEKGAYIDLLVLQFNRGHMTSHMIGQTVGQVWDNIKVKFKQDEEGLWFNKRLDEEKIKRKNYTNSRKNNRSGNNQYTKEKNNNGHMTSHTTNHMTGHMENENINKNINKNNINDVARIVIRYLNKKAKTNYKPDTKETIKLLKARVNEGFTKKDFLTVVKNMTFWLEDEKYINAYRPITLFSTKFQSYLNIKRFKSGQYSKKTANNIKTGEEWLNENS